MKRSGSEISCLERAIEERVPALTVLRCSESSAHVAARDPATGAPRVIGIWRP